MTLLDATGQPLSRRIQPSRGIANVSYIGALGGFGGLLYWLGQGSGNGFIVNFKSMGGDTYFRELRSWAFVSTAQAAKNITTYASLTGTPAKTNSPTHQTTLSMASTGWVQHADPGPAMASKTTQLWLQSEFDVGTYAIAQIGHALAFENAEGRRAEVLPNYQGQFQHSTGSWWLVGVPGSGTGMPLSHDHYVEVHQLALTYLTSLPAAGTNRMQVYAYRNQTTTPFFSLSMLVNSAAWRGNVDQGSGPEVFAPGDELYVELRAVYDGVNPWTVNHVQTAVSSQMAV